MKTVKDKIIDILCILLIALPLAAAIVVKVLVTPASEGISISGALILFEIPFFLQNIVITESQVNSWLIMISLLGLCLYLTRGLKSKPDRKRQQLAEMIVESTDGLVKDNMGDRFMAFSPFIAAMMALSAFSSLSSLLGIFPPTSDINIIGGWAILVFILITHYKLKGGLGNYLRGYAQPVFVMAPMNIISELATPVSMTMRHFGNVFSGVIVSTLVGTALASITSGLPGVLGQIPFFRIGIPAVLSLYFDIFSGLIQAFIFAMLTMQYISIGFPEDEYNKRLERKAERKRKREALKNNTI